jgi:hypothetical protein
MADMTGIVDRGPAHIELDLARLYGLKYFLFLG